MFVSDILKVKAMQICADQMFCRNFLAVTFQQKSVIMRILKSEGEGSNLTFYAKMCILF